MILFVSEEDLDMIMEECDKKDLMHAIGSTFRGVIRSEIKGDVFRLKAQIDEQKPLRRGIFISTEVKEKVWVAFKYENLQLSILAARIAEVSFVVKRMAIEEKLPILETTVYHQNLGDLVAPLFPENMENTVREELSKEIIETDIQQEWNKIKSQIGPVIPIVETCHKTKMAS
ncbi:hypothetical protein PVK06_024466 [Gossypium arboreum]|uniref:Uncharacterized protein n=1 Tax=Gossypium arboreum TaxID=29729 RepID=A0ABR0PEE3_GOSAR|nr:hypothetical protein PVK06_024466 [Gossypium arboreum]